MIIGVDTRLICAKRGGPVRYAINIIKNIASLSKEIKFILYTFNKSQISWDNSHNNIAERVFRLPQRYKFSKMIWEEFVFPYYLTKDRVDITFSPGEYISPRIKIPKVTTVHDVVWATYEPIRSDPSSHYVGKRVIKSCKNVSQIITVSNFAKKEIKNILNVGEDKVNVIYEGVEEIFHPINDKQKVQNVLERYAIKGDYLLYVGDMTLRKNIDGLITSFIIFLEKYPESNYKLVIAGQKKINFHEMIQSIPLQFKDNIIFPGFVENTELPFLYNGASIFITLSYFESFGLPSLEAMACGVPVISSNKTAMPEICRDGALLVDPDDRSIIIKSIEMLAFDNELRQKMIKKGFDRVVKFSWKKAAEETLEVFRKVIIKN